MECNFPSLLLLMQRFNFVKTTLMRSSGRPLDCYHRIEALYRLCYDTEKPISRNFESAILRPFFGFRLGQRNGRHKEEEQGAGT